MNVTDYGPALTRNRRGELITWGGASEVMVLDRPDPDRPDRGRTPPTVRGAQRMDVVLKIYGPLSRQYRAAERFRDDMALAEGARDGGMAGVYVAFHPGAIGPGDAQLDAIRRSADAWAVIPAALYSLVLCCIVEHGSIWTYRQARRVGDATAKRWLGEVLLRLDAHYAGEDGTK